MSELLDFLSVEIGSSDGFDPLWRSPLERVLRNAPPEVRDVSRTGKLDVRGAPRAPEGVDVIPLGPTRAFILCEPGATSRLRSQLGVHAFDVSAAFAGLEVRGEQLLRRLTDLDLDGLPAAGAVARIPAIVLRDGDVFRIFFPQEYADYLGAVVLDALAGLR